jgi:hypothetical protein
MSEQPVTNKYYKMIGYNKETQSYESFVVAGAPAPPDAVNPNTGNKLTHVYVSSTWTA